MSDRDRADSDAGSDGNTRGSSRCRTYCQGTYTDYATLVGYGKLGAISYFSCDIVTLSLVGWRAGDEDVSLMNGGDEDREVKGDRT